MRVAPLPPNEAERLQALRSYAVLDASSEASVDALVHVTAQVFEVPIALVSLLDAARQWFWSHVGIDITETPREIAFCSHTILKPHDCLQVQDTLLDERFWDNPLVTREPKLRFYAGVPLVDTAGFALGTLCVLDYVPRRLTGQQLEVLRKLSHVVIKLIEARRTQYAYTTQLRQNALLRLAEELAQLGHFRADLDEGRTEWSDAVRGVLGWAEQPSLTLADFVAAQHPTDRAAMANAWDNAARFGKAFDIESRVLRRDGKLRYLHVKARCERQAGRVVAVFGTVQDITERTKLRERALHQSRLAATGTLAAGVGHEINNPLTYVAGNIELAKDRLLRAPLTPERIADIVDMLDEASDGTTRIRDIVRGLRSFARSEDKLHPTDVQNALRTALSMAKHELRQRATLHEELAEHVPTVQANEARLSQVLLNLLINAAQSFTDNDPNRNHVYVRARLADGGRVVIEIEDNGAGVPKELQSRIFDPFFTTRRLGEGTGLGLSISHSLVASLKGEISCESEPGRGSTFRVSLPVAEPAFDACEGSQPSPLPGSVRPGRTRVLVIDDEPAIARSMQQVLGEYYQVTTCTDPQEACTLLLREPDAFDVVFCDLMMPCMTGMELYRRTCAQSPELARRFVFMTGASIDQQVATFLATARNPPLEKPFALDALRTLVQHVTREPHVAAATVAR